MASYSPQSVNFCRQTPMPETPVAAKCAKSSSNDQRKVVSSFTDSFSIRTNPLGDSYIGPGFPCPRRIIISIRNWLVCVKKDLVVAQTQKNACIPS